MKKFDAQIEHLTRGTVDVISREDLIRKLGENRPLKVKFGVDPSTSDLHLGHTVVLKQLQRFQEAGHRITIIIGDTTGRVGDPSGRSQTRNLLTEEAVMANAQTYQAQVFKVLDRQKTQVIFNSQWFKKMTFDEVIQLTSKFTVARMLERDDFSQRLKAGTPVSMVEMLYPLMQGFDSVMLESDIELGGTDQTFNMLVGRSLQKDYGQSSQVVMTWPLLVGTDGTKKMSKSYGNAIPIAGSPEDMFGLLMSIPDTAMPSYFELLTEVPEGEIGTLCRSGHPREAKIRLASEIVTTFHGGEAAGKAREHFERVFTRREAPEDLPQKTVSRSDFKDGKLLLVRLLVEGGLASSNAEARRLISQGGVEVSGQKIMDPAAPVEFPSSREITVKVGKRRFMKFTLTDAA